MKTQPLGRIGSIRDIADSTVFLFSNTGSYITGHILVGEFMFQYLLTCSNHDSLILCIHS